ncbi:hypothetical protein PoB_003493200 [Plakobranchus ocellatus]|uniref:Lysophospholipid acyltransferase 5 n=1 Tax=Plakobranchus ocellatus TaxID=259542 RepID=A0AAV4AND5_9GAST|nr:hypothetical protein PoB_003493200 [Plakobranchus ocellatus]
MFESSVATTLGSSEGAIKLLISIFTGYLLAFLHRVPILYKAPPTLKHVMFTVEGLALCYYNFGVDSIHVWLNVTFIYLVLLIFGGNKFTAVFTFVFNTAYLVMGYYYQIAFQEFGISWTMPLCVLTLRLTGVAFDFYDGQKTPKGDKKQESDAALTKRPGYLEMLGHTFFFGGILVGPQFSMRRYLAFVNGEYADEDSLAPKDSIVPGFRRLLLGIVYIAIFQLCALVLPNTYMVSEHFREGAIIITGMSYNGRDEHGNRRWDACTNIKVWQLETGETFSDFIQSFNVNTNQWMLRYVHRRLRFLGNKMLSQAITLFYLALWHGLQSGYYMCFFLELLETKAELEFKSLLKGLIASGLLPDVESWGWASLLGRVVRKLTLLFLWSYALVAFALLDFDKWFPIYSSVFFIGHVMCAVAIAASLAFRAISRPSPKANGVHVEKKAECKRTE